VLDWSVGNMMKLCSFESKHTKLFFAFVIGALLGMGASFTVSATLVEISVNDFFAVYFGMLFLIISGILFWRVKAGDHPKPYLLMGFSLMVMFSGLLCFMLEKEWFLKMSPRLKVPLYSMLGVSISFALLFSLIDLINYCSGMCCQGPNSKPLVETEKQVYLVVAAAVLMGFLFGLVFGLLDIEDSVTANLKLALLRDERICYPIGAVIGGTASAINQYIRDQSQGYSFNPIHDDELDPDF